jgi:hypothetical protein
MSDNDRRSKDGENQNKESQNERAAAADRHQDSAGDKTDATKGDTLHPNPDARKIHETAGN